MKKQTFKPMRLIAALLIFTGITASLAAQDAAKEISKSYDISKGYTLGVDNKYGSIEILNWDKDQLAVNVKIEIKAPSKEKAEALLKKVNIDIDESSGEVNFSTEFDSKPYNKNTHIKVIYTVQAPEYLNINLEQSYGDIFINNISGDADVEIKYGNLTANSLVNSVADKWNNLELSYGHGNIEQTGKLTTDMAYSELSVDQADAVDLESSYSEVTCGEIKKMSVESKYDKIKVQKITGEFSVESAYTNVNISALASSFTSLEAEMSYGNLKAKPEGPVSFSVDAVTRYGSIKLPGNLPVTRDNMSQKVQGTVGSNPTGNVEVTIKYGNLNME